MKNKEIIQRQEEVAWDILRKLMWPTIAKQSAITDTHPKVLIWIVARAFRMGLNAGMKIMGSATLREIGLQVPKDLRFPTKIP